MYTLVLLTGLPIITRFPSPLSTSSYVEYVVSSDGPYRFITLTTPLSYISSTSPLFNASPARFTTFTPSANLPALTNSFIADGTVFINLTSICCSFSIASNTFSSSITLPPLPNVTNSSNTDRSKQIDVVASTPSISSSLNTSLLQFISSTALLCCIATPFGLPVEPDV